MDIITATQIGAAPEFQARVRHALIASAVTKLTGTPTQPETLLGQRILDEREPLGPWIAAVVGSSSIMAGAHSVPGTSIQDSDITSAVAALWPAFVI